MKYIPEYRNGVRAARLYNAGAGECWRFDVKHDGQQRGVDFVGGSLDDDFSVALSVLNQNIVGWPQHPVTTAQIREFKGWKPNG